MSNELKPLKCPFCGHNSEKDNINPGYVFCTNPECRLHDMGLLESEWNTRPENPLQERVDQLEKQLKDTHAGLYCGHCAQTAKASHIWAKKNQDLQSENDRYKKALGVAKEQNSILQDLFAYLSPSVQDNVMSMSEQITEIETALTKKE